MATSIQVLEAMGQAPTEDELFEMISEVDDNMSGSIDFGEFLKVGSLFQVLDASVLCSSICQFRWSSRTRTGRRTSMTRTTYSTPSLRAGATRTSLVA